MQDDPDYELNQLLSRIQQLESKNEKMRKNIEEKKKEIKNVGNTYKPKPEPPKAKPKTKVITVEEDRKAELKFNNEIKFLTNNSLQIKDNLVEKMIKFEPQENYGVMYIMGDFNGWEPEIMQKNKNGFHYKVVLIKGFKYYYSFQTSDQVLIDYNNDFEENPVNLQEQNYIDLYQNKNEKTNYFDYKTDSNILKIAQRNYLLLEINDNIDNTLFLEKFQRHIIASKPDTDNSNEKQIRDSIIFYYNNLLKKIDIYDKSKFENLKLYLNDRILFQNSPVMKGVQYHYRILAMSNDDSSLICMRLYDHNQIKLNSMYYSDLDNCWKIPFSDIVSKPPNDKDKLYHLLSVKESKKIIKDFENDKENIIIAHFNDLDDLNKGTTSITRKYGKKNNLGELVKPTKIEPDDV